MKPAGFHAYQHLNTYLREHLSFYALFSGALPLSSLGVYHGYANFGSYPNQVSLLRNEEVRSPKPRQGGHQTALPCKWS